MLTRRPLGERYDAKAPLYTRVDAFGVEAGERIPDGALTDTERGQWWRIGRADHAKPMRHAAPAPSTPKAAARVRR